MTYEYTKDVNGYIAPPEKPRGFDEELVRIGGLNRHGQPNLRVVWGGNEMSDRAHERCLKYFISWEDEHKGWYYADEDGTHYVQEIEGVPPDKMVLPLIEKRERGLLRWVIEAWTSPEELEAAHRFVTTHDDEGRVLRDLPREGVYDCFFIVQRKDGSFRQLDEQVLYVVGELWRFNLLPKEEQERLIEEAKEADWNAKQKHNEEIWRAASQFDLKLDPEEKEKQERYWATKDDWKEDAARYTGTIKFYQAGV